MEFSPEQISEIREQVIEQINSTFPEEKKEEVLNQIDEMNDEQFVEFLKENNLIKSEKSENQCIFCSIVFGEIPSTKIGENEKAIAILELNPVSKGHALIIPKDHINERNKFSEEIYNLSKEIGEKINEAFHPKEIKIVEGEVMGHQIINIVPIYHNESINSPRIKKTPEELLELKEQINSKSIEQIEVKEKENIPQEKVIEKFDKKNSWLPKRRIP